MTPLKSNMEIPNIKRILNDSNRLLRSFHTTIPVSYGKFLWCNDWLGTTCFYQNKMCSSHLMFRTNSMNINIQSSIPTNLATRYLGRILNNGTPSDHREYPHMMLNYIIKQLGVYQKYPRVSLFWITLIFLGTRVGKPFATIALNKIWLPNHERTPTAAPSTVSWLLAFHFPK